jgi:molybdate transport system ATP-binding protein
MTSMPSPLNVMAYLKRGDFTLDVVFKCGRGLTALFGPSGSGKTTVLNMIAGVQRPDVGLISVAGRTLTDTAQNIFVPRHKRHVGLVFQDAQLFPHLTVGQNIRFGRWFTSNRDASDAALSVDLVVGVLGIAGLMKRRPSTLSGGEKQRVALARALLSSPRILLMDEPLSGLDDARREEIMTLIERVREEFAIPIVYVTHARDEVKRLASRVVQLNAGRVEAIGATADLLGP